MVGTVPAGVAASAQIAQAERAQAGPVVIFGATFMDPVVSHVAGALVLARMMIVAFDGIQIAGAVGCILRCLVFARLLRAGSRDTTRDRSCWTTGAKIVPVLSIR